MVREALHATFGDHAYPAHTHGDWTVLLIDDGAVSYALDRRSHHAVPAALTVLPPDIPHDGRSAVPGRPYRKRVLYLEASWLPAAAASASASAPTIADPRALALVRDVHAALDHPADVMRAECGVLELGDVVRDALRGRSRMPQDTPLARRLRALLDDRLFDAFTIAEAAVLLGANPSHLVRAFSQSYGIPPHRYVTGRRVDAARRLLLEGRSAAESAAAVGFHDQAHMSRHFRRTLGVTPGSFAA